MQLSEYELDREQRVKRNHILMGDLVRAVLYFKSFGFADCGGLFREFRSWFSSSIRSNQKLHRTDVDRMLQPSLITHFGGGEVISTLLLSFILEYSLRVSDSQNMFARYDQFAQLTVVFHILNVLSV